MFSDLYFETRSGILSSKQSDRATFKCPAKSFIFGFVMGVNWDEKGLCRSAPDGAWVKSKTTDAISFPHMMSTIKSCGHRTLRLVTHPNSHACLLLLRKQIRPSPRCMWHNAPQQWRMVSANRATTTYRSCWFPEKRAAYPIRKKKTRCLIPSGTDTHFNERLWDSHTELLKMGFICLVFDRHHLRETSPFDEGTR